MSVRPNPVTITSRVSARSSPSVSLRNRMSGELATQTPPWPTAMAEGMFNPSANTVILSAVPSPSVSSKILTRSRPSPAERRGYSRLSQTQMRPRSSKHMATGLTRSGSWATSSTWKPWGTRMWVRDSCGERAGPGGLSWAWGMTGGAAQTVERPISPSVHRPRKNLGNGQKCAGGIKRIETPRNQRHRNSDRPTGWATDAFDLSKLGGAMPTGAWLAGRWTGRNQAKTLQKQPPRRNSRDFPVSRAVLAH